MRGNCDAMTRCKHTSGLSGDGLPAGGAAARLDSSSGANGNTGWDETPLVEGIVGVVVCGAGASSQGCGHSEEGSLHVEDRNEWKLVFIRILGNIDLSLHCTPGKKRMPAERVKRWLLKR